MSGLDNSTRYLGIVAKGKAWLYSVMVFCGSWLIIADHAWWGGTIVVFGLLGIISYPKGFS